MAIQQTKKQSDLEKRLRLLRQQVYGKNPEGLRKTQMKPENQKTSSLREASKSDSRKSETPIHRYSGIPSGAAGSESFRSDITYLYQDLRKILVLSSVAVGAQIILFALSKNHIVNFF